VGRPQPENMIDLEIQFPLVAFVQVENIRSVAGTNLALMIIRGETNAGKLLIVSQGKYVTSGQKPSHGNYLLLYIRSSIFYACNVGQCHGGL
jgi:hypothetical protein